MMRKILLVLVIAILLCVMVGCEKRIYEAKVIHKARGRIATDWFGDITISYPDYNRVKIGTQIYLSNLGAHFQSHFTGIVGVDADPRPVHPKLSSEAQLPEIVINNTSVNEVLPEDNVNKKRKNSDLATKQGMSDFQWFVLASIISGTCLFFLVIIATTGGLGSTSKRKEKQERRLL